jgi:hypothetical protein
LGYSVSLQAEGKNLKGVAGFINIAGFVFTARGKNAMSTDDDPLTIPTTSSSTKLAVMMDTGMFEDIQSFTGLVLNLNDHN